VRLRAWYRAQPIRKKLFVTYATAVVLLLLVGGVATDQFVRRSLEQGIENSLSNATSSILHLIETALSGSIHNYLRGIADQDLAVVADLQGRARRGEFTDAEARARAVATLLAQRIGKTGYVCVLDSGGTMRVHPNRDMIDKELSEYAFVREITKRRQGYLEYVWQNPGENATRPKAMYMAYFPPWDWIILATSYRDEFRELVELSDLRESILSLHTGPSGYSYIIDVDGNIVLHPHFEGQNRSQLRDQGTEFIDEMIRQRSGKIRYFWRNPGEERPREKVVLFQDLPAFGWIVASASYVDEVYQPLHRVRTLLLLFVVGALLVIVVLTYAISTTITRPLERLMARVAPTPTDRVSLPGDEVRRLTESFESYIARLDAETAERRHAERALARSEETFRTAFSASPHGLCLLALEDGRLLHANKPFFRLLGSEANEGPLRLPAELGLDPQSADGSTLWKALERGEQPAPRDVSFHVPAGSLRVARQVAQLVEIQGQRRVLVTLEDVTERRQLEREVIETGDRERARLAQELHDDLAPHLVGVAALTKLVAERLGGESRESESLGKIRTWISEAVTKIRGLSRGLCAVHLVGDQLELTLREMAADITSFHGLPCEVTVHGELPSLDDAEASQVAYIAREALLNAAKHAGASRLSISVGPLDDGVRLLIADDGVGFDAAHAATGMGLRIQRYRASMIGAELRVESSPGNGTRVTVITHSGEPSR